MKADGIVPWTAPTAKTLEKAAGEKKPIVIYFPGEGKQYNSDGYFYGKDLKKLADEKAVFVRVSYTSDRAALPYADQSPIPTSKLAGDNPSRDYKVGQYPTFIVADSNGNEFFRVEGKKPTVKDLEGYFDQLPKKVEDLNKKLQNNLEAANAAWEKKDSKKALESVLKNFKFGVVGLEAQEGTKRLYTSLLEDARAKLAEIKDKSNKDNVNKMKAMQKDWKGTEIYHEIAEILKS